MDDLLKDPSELIKALSKVVNKKKLTSEARKILRAILRDVSLFPLLHYPTYNFDFIMPLAEQSFTEFTKSHKHDIHAVCKLFGFVCRGTFTVTSPLIVPSLKFLSDLDIIQTYLDYYVSTLFLLLHSTSSHPLCRMSLQAESTLTCFCMKW